jgi:hypothetical protein
VNVIYRSGAAGFLYLLLLKFAFKPLCGCAEAFYFIHQAVTFSQFNRSYNRESTMKRTWSKGEMMRLLLLCVCSGLLIAACSPGGDDVNDVLPTVFEFPTDAPTEAGAQVEVTEETTAEETEEATDTPQPSATSTQRPSDTPAPTVTPTNTATPNPTLLHITTLTAVAEMPRFYTLTPQPAGAPEQPTPLVLADVVITRQQLQDEVDLRIAETNMIESAQLSFVPGDGQGIRVGLVASGGQALVSGDVFVSFEVFGGLVAIGVTDIVVGSGDPPERFAEIASIDLVETIVDSFDSILRRRLGDDQDMETLVFTQNAMNITLLVPER